MPKTNLKFVENDVFQAPQPVLPNVPFLLNKADAEEFHAGLEKVRSYLPEGNKHFLKMKSLSDLQHDNAYMIGIRNEFNTLVSGTLVILPITRLLAKNYVSYPLDAKGDVTAVISSLWTDPNFLRRGFAQALIEKAVDLAKEKDIRHVLTGIAEGNNSHKNFEKAGFAEVSARRDLDYGHMMSFMKRNLL